MPEDEDSDKWSILDVLRVLGGALIVVMGVMWQMGGFQALRGTKWATRQYWRHAMAGWPQREFTMESLQASRDSGEVLVGLNATVYDVSSNGAFYLGSRYAELVGADCSALFISGRFGEGVCSPVWEHTLENDDVIHSWEILYNKKYVAVGTLILP